MKSLKIFALTLIFFVVNVNEVYGDKNVLEFNEQDKMKPVNYDKECEERFKISKQKSRIKELENQLNACKNKDKQINSLKKEVNNFKNELKSKSKSTDEVKSKFIENERLLEETRKNLDKVRDEIDYYKSHVNEVILLKFGEYYNLTKAEIGVYYGTFSSFYQKTIDGTFFGRVIDSAGEGLNSLKTSVFTIIEASVVPVFRQFLSNVGLTEEEEIFSFLTKSFRVKGNELKNSTFEYFQELRNVSITKLQKNPRVSYLAEEIIDLSLLCLCFFSFLVVVNPVVAFVVRTTYSLTKKIVFTLFNFPMSIINQTKKQFKKEKTN